MTKPKPGPGKWYTKPIHVDGTGEFIALQVQMIRWSRINQIFVDYIGIRVRPTELGKNAVLKMEDAKKLSEWITKISMSRKTADDI